MIFLNDNVELGWFIEPLIKSGYAVTVRLIEDEDQFYYKVEIIEKGC